MRVKGLQSNVNNSEINGELIYLNGELEYAIATETKHSEKRSMINNKRNQSGALGIPADTMDFTEFIPKMI